MKRLVTAAFVLAAVYGAIAAAGGSAESAAPPPTTAHPGASVAVSTDRSASTEAADRVVLRGVQNGKITRNAESVTTDAADYVILEVGNESGPMTVTIYRRFEPEELAAVGLPEQQNALGRVWIGEDSNEFRSIYFLPTKGVGLHIYSPGNSRSIAEIIKLAMFVGGDHELAAVIGGGSK
jgi:uncharacterized protein YdeI (BOF family)